MKNVPQWESRIAAWVKNNVETGFCQTKFWCVVARSRWEMAASTAASINGHNFCDFYRGINRALNFEICFLDDIWPLMISPVTVQSDWSLHERNEGGSVCKSQWVCLSQCNKFKWMPGSFVYFCVVFCTWWSTPVGPRTKQPSPSV